MDYCNAILAGFLALTLVPFERVPYMPVRAVLSIMLHDHITSINTVSFPEPNPE